jgi:phosphoribosylanthranilate isomerase
MARVRVKICGIGSFEDARLALDLGADALGFNFWSGSPRYVEPAVAREIITRLVPFGSYVGVFVNETAAIIRELVSDVGLTSVQLHGDELPEFSGGLAPLKVIKAIRVGPGFDPASVRCHPASAILLDARVGSSYGGTGHTFDWSAAIEAKKYAQIILAGGITSENVTEAIRAVRPLAVDVCSGVESRPGKKDPVKLRDIMAAVDLANSDLANSDHAEADLTNAGLVDLAAGAAHES